VIQTNDDRPRIAQSFKRPSLTRPRNVFSHFGAPQESYPKQCTPSPLCRALCVGISGVFLCPWLASRIFWPVPAFGRPSTARVRLTSTPNNQLTIPASGSHDTTFGGFHMDQLQVARIICRTVPRLIYQLKGLFK
jgi:hypothetical protein